LYLVESFAVFWNGCIDYGNLKMCTAVAGAVFGLPCSAKIMKQI